MEIWETPLITRFLLSLVNLKEKHVHDICPRNKGKPYVISGTMPSNIQLSILKIKQWAIIRLLWLLLVLFGPFLRQLDYQSFLDSSKINFQTLKSSLHIARCHNVTLVTSSNVSKVCMNGECITKQLIFFLASWF